MLENPLTGRLTETSTLSNGFVEALMEPISRNGEGIIAPLI